MAKITKVPNGPLIKKKGPFKGSTLRAGGTIKKAINGTTTTQTTTRPMTRRDSLIANIKEQNRLRQNLTDFRNKVGSRKLTPDEVIEKNKLNALLDDFSTKQRVKSTGLTEQQLAKNDSIYTEKERKKKSPVDDSGQLRCIGKDNEGCSGSQRASDRRIRQEARRKNGGPVKKAKAGAMIKRAQNGDTTTVKKPKVDGFFKNIDKKLIKKSDTTGFYKGGKSKIIDDGFFKGPKVKSTGLKNGGLIKRADGSYSKRGLWDNIRANKGSGKKPTKQMLVQEKKIKAKTKK
jgi:hypothetical protein